MRESSCPPLADRYCIQCRLVVDDVRGKREANANTNDDGRGGHGDADDE